MADIEIGVIGAAGRMGQMLVQAVAEANGAVLAGASERPDHTAMGKDAGSLAGLEPLNVPLTDSAADLFGRCDVVIDFTAPAASVAHAETARDHGTALVIGTTGLDAAQTEAIGNSAQDGAAIVWAPNMSLGVNLLFALTEKVARALGGDDWDIEIVEMHHKHKVDAPSGTALGLGQAAAAGRGVDLDSVSQRVRDGHTGPRKTGDIGFATLRGGDVVGEHTVIFATEGERVELSHKGSSRTIFSRGAVRAAIWAAAQKPGLYDMFDVLGLPR